MTGLEYRLNMSRRALCVGMASAGLLAGPGSAVRAAVGAGAAADPLTVARRELGRLGDQIAIADRVGIVDFSLPSWAPRFALVDMVAGTTEWLPVTHGRGSDPVHEGWVRQVSNRPGSLASSRGAYRTGEYYVGKHDISMRLDGLDPDNHLARDRAIVVHGAWYAEPDMIARHGKLGRSEGCFAFGAAINAMVLDRLGPGRLLFADYISPLAPPVPPVTVAVVDEWDLRP